MVPGVLLGLPCGGASSGNLRGEGYGWHCFRGNLYFTTLLVYRTSMAKTKGSKRYTPNDKGLWGIRWMNAGSFWSSHGISMWQEGDDWVAKTRVGDQFAAAQGASPLGALVSLLGASMRLGHDDMFYPLHPEGAELRKWLCAPLTSDGLKAKGVLIQQADGWHWDQTDRRYPSAEEAYRAVLRWEGWGAGWLPLQPYGSGWIRLGYSLRVQSDRTGGWVAAVTVVGKTTQSQVMGTPEAALENLLGAPMMVLGVPYYPLVADRTLFRSKVGPPFEYLFRQASGWKCTQHHVTSGHSTPEEAIVECYRNNLVSCNTALREAMRDLATLRQAANAFDLKR